MEENMGEHKAKSKSKYACKCQVEANLMKI